jgi:hypothetical protein
MREKGEERREVYTFVIKSIAYGFSPESYTVMTMGRIL